MSSRSPIRQILFTIGLAFLVFGLFIVVTYVSKLNADADWGERHLLVDLGFIAFGITLELFGMGIIVLGNEAK